MTTDPQSARIARAQSASDIGHAPAGLEDRLLWLCRFGVPRVSKVSDGWHARIEMNTNTTGSNFEVVTRFDHQTPTVAVDVLIDRMIDALTAIGVRP